MITFFANVRPFTGEFDGIQRTAIASWMGVHPEAQVVIIGDVEGACDAAGDLGATWVPGVQTNRWGTELVNDIWAIGAALARHEWVCALNSDNLIWGDIRVATEALHTERPFVVGQRCDYDRATGSVKLHPPCGVDWFLFRRGTVPTAEIPPFAVGRTLYDNWLVWAAVERWGLTVIDATADVTVTHVNHGFPEYGSKQRMIASEEKQENTRIFWESGAPRPYGVNDAPLVLANGEIQERCK